MAVSGGGFRGGAVKLMGADLSAGPGERVDFGPPALGPLQTVCERPARMLVAEASEQQLDGQVFWLTARSGPGRPSRLAAVARRPGAWPITAAAPRRIRTVFPILPLAREGRGNLSSRHIRAECECSRQADEFMTPGRRPTPIGMPRE